MKRRPFIRGNSKRRPAHSTRGSRSNAPGGYGTITPKGHRRIWDTEQKRYRMEHDVIWERAHGPIPEGFHVHHRDENKLNNDLTNLDLVDALTHKRLHSGCELRADGWWKPCRKCTVMQPISEYYERQSGVSPWCKSCCKANATANKRKRRAARRAA